MRVCVRVYVYDVLAQPNRLDLGSIMQTEAESNSLSQSVNGILGGWGQSQSYGQNQSQSQDSNPSSPPGPILGFGKLQILLGLSVERRPYWVGITKST